MAVTIGDLILLDPSLATIPTATLQAILDNILITIRACAWGDKYDLAVKLLAAHTALMWLRSAGGVSGVVVEERVGDVQRKYGASTATTSNDLDQSPWGQWYQRLLRGTLGARGPLLT